MAPTGLMARFVAVALLLIPVISCQSEAPVGIFSALEEGVLCPDDITTFTCITRGNELVWGVNGIIIRYGTTTDVSSVRQREGHSSLAHRAGLEDGMFLFTSVLYVNQTSVGSDEIEIECHNGRTSLQKTITYRPLLPAMPAQPDAVNASMVTTMILSEPVVLIIVTWTHDNSTGSTRHYLVQMGDRQFVVQSTSLHFAMPPATIPSAIPSEVNVTAVDRCGRVSSAVTTELVDFTPESTTAAPTTQDQGQPSCAPASIPEIIADVGELSSINPFSSSNHIAKVSVAAVFLSFFIATQSITTP